MTNKEQLKQLEEIELILSGWIINPSVVQTVMEKIEKMVQENSNTTKTKEILDIEKLKEEFENRFIMKDSEDKIVHTATILEVFNFFLPHLTKSASGEELDGLVLAQNQEQYYGYTVFHLPFTGGTLRMMSIKDVEAVVEKLSHPENTKEGK